MHSITYAAVGVLLVGVYLARRRRTASSLPLPPGPKPLPLIGNLHQAPKSHAWRKYLEWSKAYGPIVHVNMLGQSVIILSSSQVAHDLLAKRGAIFSDRPRLFLATELALKGFNLLMMNYTDQLRRHQKLQTSVLNPTPVSFYLPFQLLESKQLLLDLLHPGGGNAGRDVHGYFQRTVASIIHTLLYGFRIHSENDPILRTVIQLNDEFSGFVQVGAHIVDTFPVLNNLPAPLAPWKAIAESHYQRKYALRMENFRKALASPGWNISKHLKRIVETEKVEEMPTDELAFELGTMIDAALDGTTDSLLWFIVACVTQKHRGGFIDKAREELDAVVGRARLPTLDDRVNLPYITAITEEVYRWRPIAPEGAPHLNREEAEYEGYTIPARSVIVPNIWAITREEAVFGPDTDEFIPERWLEDDGKTVKSLPLSGFGFGRRICPGRYFARNTIWVIVAQVLWAFEVSPGRDEVTGEVIPVDDEACTYGLVMRSLPFKACFEARGKWVEEVLGDGDTYGEDHIAMLDKIAEGLASAK
ncbi:hypothetical protein H072_7435 [Dactylellina haptotyla CBS 200.50]|uniref:Cytochrome P450 n=1 Tax=Dactylellina haptotyla (strain CBS 200.50) TaxID=1284197 RepID=S8BHJ8_DACHA|nr:hypothetical protein H072_7435 [Dactylellina haptotyla CBS 200.50]